MTSVFSRAQPRVRHAMAAVFAVFLSAGFVFASWASRIPTVQSELDLAPRQMGLLLLAGSFGSVIALPVSGRIIGRFGAARTVMVGVVLITVGLSGAVAAVPAGLVLWVGVGLFIALMGVGAMDVAMNFEGTLVEQRLGQAIMPWFHGCFSLGTIVGAGLGTMMSRLDVAITTHVWGAVAITVIAASVSIRYFFPLAGRHAGESTDHDASPSPESAQRGSHYLGAWLEPRTLMVGLIVLATSLTEGAANDWLALGIREGFGVPEHQGAFGLTIFVTAMTAMRFSGTWLLDTYGRVAVLRLSTILAIVGLAIFGLVPSLPIAMVGAVLWGLGAALGFPVGMSAASDDPVHAAARLSVVSTIGYTAFLAGPPLLGILADYVGYRHALLAIIVPLVAGLIVVKSAAPPQTPPTRTPISDASDH